MNRLEEMTIIPSYVKKTRVKGEGDGKIKWYAYFLLVPVASCKS